jgi:Arc/MetJ family transcription regulator
MCDAMCKNAHMATNLSIDPELLDRALEVSGERTKKAAVTKALQEFIGRREQKRILELFGKIDWDPTYDYKAARKRR